MNDLIFYQSTQLGYLEMIQRYMKAGLLHKSRACSLCGMQMSLGQFMVSQRTQVKSDKHYEGNRQEIRKTKLYFYCHYCGRMSSIIDNSLVHRDDLVTFDRTLQLFCHVSGVHAALLSRILYGKNRPEISGSIMNLAIFSLAHYWKK